jgi:hypothetical protein
MGTYGCIQVYLLIAIAIDFARSYPSLAVRLTKLTQRRPAAVPAECCTEDEDVAAEAQRVGAPGVLAGCLVQVSWSPRACLARERDGPLPAICRALPLPGRPLT